MTLILWGLIVPALCVGMPLRTLCVPGCVPTQSVGTINVAL